ncbi:MAG: thioesterase [Pseudomonadota bacterium]|nr:thioesterase [Pseudomonadota bacterium]
MVAVKLKKEYVVKSYEADCHGFLRLPTLLNLLQDAATDSARELGFGYEKCMELGLTWFGSDYFLEIERLPELHEHFFIETWPAETKLWGAIRDFVVCDAQKNVIMRVSSQWVLIDLARKRPVVLSKYFPEHLVLAERCLPVSFTKIKEPDNFEREDEIKVRFDDIDLNNHVNNAVYPLWASECVEADFRMKHSPKEIEINFKKGAVYGDKVVILSTQSGPETYHSIRESDKTTELARCRIVWRDITSA